MALPTGPCSRDSGDAPPQRSPGARAQGFTLLEVVIALAILGIGLGVILPGIGLALRLRTDAAQEARLAIAAEQLLGELVQRKQAPRGAEEGEIDGCSWVLEPLEDAPEDGGGEGVRRGAVLAVVRLTLTAPGGQRWEFRTLLPRGAGEGPP